MTTSDSTPPPVDYTQEIRFAVVMYGGISLAIYMNGIAQELLHLVRATAPDPNDPLRARRSDAELSGSELVYRKLGCLLARGKPLPAEVPATIRTRFVVDVLTGTSAGGINAVYLAKALANDQSIADLERLWVDEGDIARLVNDARAVEDLPITLDEPPRAPLSGDRMYLKLLHAFDGMDGAAPRAARAPDYVGERSPNVDELDLFVTATDVRGWRTTLSVADAQPDERRYGTVFRLRYRSVDGDALAGGILGAPPGPAQAPPAPVPARNDFVPFNNPFLAFVARATSAHQAAFQPVRLSDVGRLLAAHPIYRREPWLIAGKAPPEWEALYPPAYADAQAGAGLDFFRRDFADGGVLDNKPFSYVLDTIARRSRVRPVTRKLLFVDPAPERFRGEDAGPPPDYVENGLTALLTIRGYETIREDLERLERYNRQAAELRMLEAAALSYERDLDAFAPKLWEQLVAQRRTRKELRESALLEHITYYGNAWVTYIRLRVMTTASFLGRLLARGAGIEDGSPRHGLLLAAVRAWVGLHYAARDPREGPTIIHFLLDFDSDWHLRRLRRTLADLDELVDASSGRAPTLVRMADRYGQLLGLPPLESYPPADQAAFDQTLADLRRALGLRYSELQAERARLVDDEDLYQLVAAIKACELPALLDRLAVDPQLAGDRLEAMLAQLLARPPAASPAFALRTALERLIRGPGDGELLDRLLAGKEEWRPNLQALVGALIARSQAGVYADLGIVEEYDERPRPSMGADNSIPASVARFSLLEFERYDRVLYPTTALSEIGDERDGVEVYRVSPLDAPSLIDEQVDGSKLAGTALGAFGAFFERKFRLNDIRWGRLDGAERIITALLPAPEQAALRRQLIVEAQDAILQESFFSDPEHAQLARIAVTPELRREAFLRSVRETREESRQMNNEAFAGSLARISHVVNQMFAAYGEAHPQARPLTLWASRLLGVGASVVDAALARSLSGVLKRQWLPLIYLFALLQIIIGAVFSSPSVQTFGMIVGGAALAFHFLVLLVRDLLAGRRGWQLIGWALAGVVLALALFAATLFGLWLAGRVGPDTAADFLALVLRPESFLIGASVLVGGLLIVGLVLTFRSPPSKQG